LFLLAWVTFEPWMSRFFRFGRPPVELPAPAAPAMVPPVYRRILVPLDHTALDRAAIAHAASMARQHQAKLFLLHVEEGVTSQIYGALASTAEVEAGRQYLDEIVRSLEDGGIAVESLVVHSSNPKNEIVRYAREISPDLLIMGAHGHHRFKDLIFGDTIDPVRHEIDTPILIVRG
jgi:manganese transport protein